jgi:hypothetical protein
VVLVNRGTALQHRTGIGVATTVAPFGEAPALNGAIGCGLRQCPLQSLATNHKRIRKSPRVSHRGTGVGHDGESGEVVRQSPGVGGCYGR